LDNASTALTPEEQTALIPSLATRGELYEWEHKNILEAQEWALRRTEVRANFLLTEPFIRELHRRMFVHVWKWAGQYRTSNKNLGIPFHQIPERIGILLGNAKYWVQNNTYDLDKIAVRVHHEAVVIHPFSDGNGRQARLWADAIVVRGGRKMFSWGFSDLAAAGPVRNIYIKALQAADGGNIKPLLLFARS
jgi:Fic-DOC domain mobile mystery protein B